MSNHDAKAVRALLRDVAEGDCSATRASTILGPVTAEEVEDAATSLRLLERDDIADSRETDEPHEAFLARHDENVDHFLTLLNPTG